MPKAKTAVKVFLSLACLAAAPALLSSAPCWAYQLGNIDVDITGQATETYDDNITLLATNTKDDYITNLGVGIVAKTEGHLNSLSFSANIFQHLYNTYSEFDNTSEDFTLAYQQEFSKYDRLSVSDTFTHAEDPQSFEDELGRTTGRYTYTRNRLSARFTHDISSQLSVNYRLGNDIDEYSRADLSDSMQYTLGAGAEYAFSSQTIAIANYDFSERDYDPGSSTRIHGLEAGARHYFTSHFYTEDFLGVNFLRTTDGKDYTRPFYSASLINELSDTTTARVSFTKEYSSNAYSQDLFNYWQAAVSLAKQLMERLSGAVSLYYGKGTYISSDIEDKLTGARASLAYDLRDNVKLTLSYSYSKTDSNIATRDYERNVTNLGIRIEF